MNITEEDTEQLFAAYKGEELICTGTIAEICSKTGYTESTVNFCRTPSAQKRNKGKSLVVVEIAGRKRRGNKAGEFSIRNYMTNQIMFKGTAQQCADYASTTLGVVYLYSSQRKVLDDRYIFERTDEKEYASKKTKLTEEDIKTICERYRKGEKFSYIMNDYHIGQKRLLAILKNNGLHSIDMKKPLDIGKVHALYNAKWSIRMIADEMHIPDYLIEDALKKPYNQEDYFKD